MNAIQPSTPRLQPVPSRQVARSYRGFKRNQPTTAIALETTAKLTVNLIFCAAAIGALIQLLPYHKSVQIKLDEIGVEVKQTEERVTRLQKDFNRSFDPQQAKIVMQEQSHRVDPARRQVVLLEKNPHESDDAERGNFSP